MAVTVTKTGKTRYRVHKTMTGKELVVLQVEEHFTGYYLPFEDFSVSMDELRWRDATVQDITESSDKNE